MNSCVYLTLKAQLGTSHLNGFHFDESMRFNLSTFLDHFIGNLHAIDKHSEWSVGNVRQ